MTIRTGHTVGALLTAAVFAATAALYQRLPDPMPSHWNARGLVDGWLPKPWGPFLIPLVMLGLLGLLAILPRVSPRRFEVDRFAGVYATLEIAVLLFLAAIAATLLWAALGHPQAVVRAVPAACGLLFVVLGNYLGKVTKNFFVGIRTPWTLASDEVWLRTHRLGGKLFVAAGLVTLASAPTGHALPVMLTATLAAAGVSVAYSYWAYRHLEGFHPSHPDDRR
jgi:uncharacterized membrane protein